ncbi:MAG: EAL domain-containing protein [Chloroflexi bacterium]|nr:EAL domain-containing protein [Chloroflexota bacterium]
MMVVSPLIDQLRRLSLAARFTLVGGALGVLVAVGLAWYIDSRLTDLLLDQMAARAVDQAQLGIVGRHVTAADFEPPYPPDKLDDLEARLAPLLVLVQQRNSGIIRLHIFARDGTVLFSDLASKRGQVHLPSAGSPLAHALAGSVAAQLSSLDSDENADLRERYEGALEVYVPLVLEGRVVGAYEIYQDLAPLRPVRPLVAGGFLLLLLVLAAVLRRAAEAIRRQQAERERLGQQAAKAEALQELARQAATEPDAERAVGLICQHACRLVGADFAAAMLLETDGTASWQGVWGNCSDLWDTRLRPGSNGPAHRALAAGGTVIAERLGKNPDYPLAAFPLLEREGARTVLATPLFSRDGALGTLVLGWRTDVTPPAEQVRLAEALASYAAAVIESARARAALGDRAAELAASETRLRTLYEAVACGVLMRDAAGEIVHANRAAEEMLGQTFDRMRGRGVADSPWQVACEDDSDLPVAERPSSVAFRTRRPVRKATLSITRLDGEQRWFQVDCVPVLGAGGEPVQVVSSFIDITARKKAEAMFRGLVESAPDAIVTVAHDGRIVLANAQAEQLFGYQRQELLGQPIEALLPERLRAAHVGHRTAYAAAPSARQIGRGRELVGQRKDGSEFPIELTLSRLETEDGVLVTAVIHDLTERKRAEEMLAHQALHDALTGLPNRVLLHDRLHQAVLAARRHSTSLALLVMDLDRFKEVNDTLGHHAGDVVLQQVGQRLQGTLRTSDTVARLGGDEFAVILPTAGNMASATVAASKLLHALEQPFAVEGQSLDVGASIGIALYPEHGQDAETLLRRADIAMYVAKRTGSGYALYALEQDQHSPGRLALVGELRQAIEQDALRLHYQPKVHFKSGRILGVEALVRWQHPQHGLLAPDRFISLAEQTGLIHPLSHWVLQAALRQCQSWRQAGVELPVAVNLSARNLQDPRLPGAVAALLERWDVPPRCLGVEITENAAMADPERAMQVLTRLREMGVRIAVDDFGTGYSSLGYLKRLPVDELKIDQSFVRSMATNESDAAIVRATIELGHSLGLEVVAEGVENQTAWDLLAALGCDGAQGYYLSHPLAADELVRWVSQTPWWVEEASVLRGEAAALKGGPQTSGPPFRAAASPLRDEDQGTARPFI